MADLELFAPGLRAAPLTYQVPGGQEIGLKVLAATFDGTGAGSAWQPAIQIVGPSGQVLRTFALEPSLAAGVSADVTFFPGGQLGKASAGGGGLQFDTEPQAGDWLDYETTGADANGYGTTITNLNGMLLQPASNNAIATLVAEAAGTLLDGVQALEADAILTGGTLGSANAATFFATNDDAAPASGLGASGTITGTGTGNATGGLFEADVRSGKAVGVSAHATQHAGGTAFPFEGYIGNVLVFRIDAAGNIHGKVGGAVIFDL